MRRVAFLDIEVRSEDSRFPPTNVASDPLVSISIIDTYLHEDIRFGFRKDIKIKKGERRNIKKDTKLFEETGTELPRTTYYYNKEREMLIDIVKFISETDPDILTGWNSNNFDLPYFINRLRHPRINLKSYVKLLSDMMKVYVVDLSKERQKKDDKGVHTKKMSTRLQTYRPMIGGRICFDCLDGYRNFKEKHEEGDSLFAVMKRELNIQKKSENISKEDWYETDFDQFLNYNDRDTEGVYEIDKKAKIIDFHDFIQKFNGCLWDKVYEKSIIVDSFMLMHMTEVALPTKIPSEREHFKGAEVLVPAPGIYGINQKDGLNAFIICLDLSKQYPNNMRSANMSPETLVPDGIPDNPKKMNILPNGVRFWKAKRLADDVKFNPKTMVDMSTKHERRIYLKKTVGFVPQALTKMFKIREGVEAERDACEYGTYEYKNLTGKRQNVKDTLNAVWGWIAYPGSRVYRIKIAKSIPYIGRRLIFHNRDLVKSEYGSKVLYGDTDSIFVLVYAHDLQEVVKIGKQMQKRLQESYDEFARKKLNLQEHFFEIEFEKVMSFMVFTKAKKRYVGLVTWMDGHEIYTTHPDGTKTLGQLYYRGIEMRRSDAAWISKKVQRDVYTMLGRKATAQEVFDYLYEVVQDVLNGKYKPTQIGVPKGLKQDFNKYETDSPWVRGCEYSNDYLKANFARGSKPMLLYIKEVHGMTYPETNEVCIDVDMDELPVDFVIDYEVMAEKTIRAKLRFILNALGINWSDLVDGIQSTKLDRWLRQ